MNKNIFILSVFAASLMACTIEETGSTSQAESVVLDVRCAADADCPESFECETEIEHGVDTSYCVSHEGHDSSNGACPAGFELEIEHEGTFCKPHGGDDNGSDDSGSDDNGGTTGDAVEGAACQSSADCAAGLECEVEVEHGVTTSSCKAHGGAA